MKEGLPKAVVPYPTPIPYNRIIVRLEPGESEDDLGLLVVAGPAPEGNISPNHATMSFAVSTTREAHSVAIQLLSASEAILAAVRAWERENVR